AAAAEAAAAEVAAAEAAAQEPATHVLSVRTNPPNATLELDGDEVANPFRGELEAGSRHRLSASAEGHRDATQTVRLSGDRDVVLRLRPRPAPRISASVGARRGGAARRSGSASRRGGAASSGGSARRSGGASGGGRRGAGFSTDNPY
ncbi:MAG: PEGA domain-containing protein, partial [Sandaracinaceae bacterium]